MSIVDEFIKEFKVGEPIYFASMRRWYTSFRRRGSKQVQPSQVWSYLISPLMQAGKIMRIERGVYMLTAPGLNVVERVKEAKAEAEAEASRELDEFDLYLRQKGIG